MATTKFTQHSKESELKDLNTERGHGIRLSNSPEGRVTRPYHAPSSSSEKPVAPYTGKRIPHADRPN